MRSLSIPTIFSPTFFFRDKGKQERAGLEAIKYILGLYIFIRRKETEIFVSII